MCDDQDLDSCTVQEILEWGKGFFREYVTQWMKNLRLHAEIVQESHKL